MLQRKGKCLQLRLKKMLIFQNIKPKKKKDFNSVEFVYNCNTGTREIVNISKYQTTQKIILIPLSLFTISILAPEGLRTQTYFSSGVACLRPKSERSDNLKYIRVRKLQYTSHKGWDVHYIENRAEYKIKYPR